ncbi:MAG: lytic transglycosylase F [Desulfosarcina sp.]
MVIKDPFLVLIKILKDEIIKTPLRIHRSFTFFLIICLFCPVFSIRALENTFTEETLIQAIEPFFGDWDEMVQKRTVRVLMPYNRAFFFFDGLKAKGISYENAMHFQEYINKKQQTGILKIHVLVIPTPREKLLTRLKEGKGDIAIGNLTITDERKKTVDFSDPFAKRISEILVTHKDRPEVTELSDLAGMEIHVRKSSSYHENLTAFNERLDKAGKNRVSIVAANEHLEDSDLLEMVNAELIPAIIMDEHKGRLWVQVFNNIRLHPAAAVHSGGQIGWAIRKDSPQLKAVINRFVKDHKVGSLMGNIMINRYLKDAAYITNSTSGKEIEKFQAAAGYFKKYAARYAFDDLMLAALAYQESRLDQSLKSHVGAVGVMQILPSTAEDKNVGIPDIEKIEPNIHAGTKYLRFLADRYFPEAPGLDALNRTLFTFAAYNAGPARISKLRKEAEKMGLDPNVWFHHVEVVAARRIGRETVQYVSNIMKYYVAYKLLEGKLRP